MATDKLGRTIVPGDIVLVPVDTGTLAFMKVESVAEKSVKGVYAWRLEWFLDLFLDPSQVRGWNTIRKFEFLRLYSEEEFKEIVRKERPEANI